MTSDFSGEVALGKELCVIKSMPQVDSPSSPRIPAPRENSPPDVWSERESRLPTICLRSLPIYSRRNVFGASYAHQSIIDTRDAQAVPGLLGISGRSGWRPPGAWER